MNLSLNLRAAAALTFAAALGLPAMLQPARAVDTSWVATRTQAFLPDPAAPPQAAATARRPATLLAASRTAVPLPADTGKHVVLVLNARPALPTDAQIQAAVDYLKQNRFTKIRVTDSRRLIEATGTVASIQRAFRTTLKGFHYEGRYVFANDAPAQVPQALAGTVMAVLGLQNVAMLRTFGEVTAPGAQADSALTAEQPWTRNAQGKAIPTSRAPHQVWEFAHLYDADLLPGATDHAAAMIASGDLSATLYDLEQADPRYVPTTPVQVIRTDNGTYADDPQKDIEWTAYSETIISVAGGLGKLVIYNVSDLSDANIMLAVDKIVADANRNYPGGAGYTAVLAPFGMWEEDAHRTGFMDAFDQAVAPYTGAVGAFAHPLIGPVTFPASQFVVPAGNDGPYPQYQGIILDSRGNFAVCDICYSVNFPASSNQVDAIGGTSLFTTTIVPGDPIGYGTGVYNYAWESAWNQGVVRVDASVPGGGFRLLAGGGGLSQYEPARLQHTLTNQPRRIVPDFAYDADTRSGAWVTRSYPNSSSTYQIGGTGLAAAIHAGLISRIGLWQQGDLFGILDDIVGFNRLLNTGYTRGQLARPVNYGGNGYYGRGYQAGVGYDAVGGWGSIDALYMKRAYQQLSIYRRY